MSLISTGSISLDSIFNYDVTSFLLLDFLMCTQRSFFIYITTGKKPTPQAANAFFQYIYLRVCTDFSVLYCVSCI
jgi:hypothetical protein